MEARDARVDDLKVILWMPAHQDREPRVGSLDHSGGVEREEAKSLHGRAVLQPGRRAKIARLLSPNSPIPRRSRVAQLSGVKSSGRGDASGRLRRHGERAAGATSDTQSGQGLRLLWLVGSR